MDFQESFERLKKINSFEKTSSYSPAMRMKNILFLICLLTKAVSWSQNLIDNGDFESYSSLPTNVMQSNLCVGWTKCNQGGGGTPDYFHTNGTGLVHLPNAFYATIQPHSGNAIMGIIAYHGVSTDYREYIAHALSVPFIVGQTYELTYFVSNGVYNGNYGGSACNNLGVAFTMGEPQQIGTSPMSFISPQLVENSLIYDTSWTQLNYTFVADSAYDHIVLGNFQSNTNTQIQNIENNSIDLAYYFVDDVSLVRVTSNVGLSSSAMTNTNCYVDLERQIVHISCPNGKANKFIVTNEIGERILEKNIYQDEDLDMEHWPKGMYFYRFLDEGTLIESGKFFQF